MARLLQKRFELRQVTRSHRPSDQRRYGNEPQLVPVGGHVEVGPRAEGRGRHCYTERSKLRVPQIQRIECRPEDVFDDRQSPFWRDNDAIGTQGAVRTTGVVLL